MPYMPYNQTPPPEDQQPSGGTPPASQSAGNTQANSAARSASFHHPMNPRKDPNVLTHTRARMLPLFEWQSQVYRLAERHPPGFEDGFTPIWEVATAILPSLKTTQLRINFQNQFHLLAITGLSSLAGGFRVQVLDTKKIYNTWIRDKMSNLIDAGPPQDRPGVRFAGRGVNFANFCGTGSDPFYLPEPHPFTEKDAQALVIVQNQDNSGANNSIQVVLYGMARRFNWPD
jgi:hypothetical protein